MKPKKTKAPSKIKQMSLHSHCMLYDSIHDFKRTAANIENEVTRLGLCHNSLTTVSGMGNRKHHDMWISLKSVSHFNLGIALELMLKMILTLNGVSFENKHSLVYLHDRIPEKFRKKLQTVYDACDTEYGMGFNLVAFTNTSTPVTPQPPQNVNLSTFRDMLRYLDHDVMLHLKRYVWEQTREGTWRHYISDISAFVMMIDHVMGEIPRDDIANQG